jgi:hypothetical protein
MADLNELNSTLPVKVVGADASGVEQSFVQSTASGAQHVNLRDAAGNELLGQKTSAGSVPVVLASDSGLEVSATEYSSYSPDQQSYPTGTAGLIVDASGRLETHSTVTTDEGSFRDDFSGSSLGQAVTGTCTFTASSVSVIGVGTSFTTQLKAGSYIKKTADSEALYEQISDIVSDTELTLTLPYGGTTATTTAINSQYQTSVVGGSITVGSSLVNLLSSTASGNKVSINRQGDYGPFNAYFKASVSQRIANQTTIVGMVNDVNTITMGAYFQFDGTVNTSVKCISQSSSAVSDIQTTVITVPDLAITSALNLYEVDITNNQVTFLINQKVVAIHQDHLPGPYDSLQLGAVISNSAVVTTTTLSLDFILFANVDQLEITNNFTGEPQRVLLQGTDVNTGLPTDLKLDTNGNLIVTSLTGFNANFTFGDRTLAATAQQPVYRNAYTRQTVNGPWSIVSSSANDVGGGTGARFVQITYLTQTGAGPFTETVTMNGTTAVNFAAQMCYVEKIQVLQAGSTGSNVGTLTLRNAQNGGGTVITTIAPTENQTFLTHHYVPVGSVCKITGVSVGHSGTTVGSGGVFVLKAIPIAASNVTELLVSDFIRLYGQSSTFGRNYQSPITVIGPARITLYVTPESTASTVFRGAFDFFEP